MKEKVSSAAIGITKLMYFQFTFYLLQFMTHYFVVLIENMSWVLINVGKQVSFSFALF